MNKLNYLFILSLFIGLVSFKNVGDVKTFVLNTDYSKVNWTGYKIAGEHKGELLFSDGSLLFENSKLVGGELTVDMNKLSCTDLTDKAQNAKLVEHLKSPDFFGVATHSTASLKIKKAYSYGEFDTKQAESVGEKYKVIADLTIKGITKEIKFEANVYQYNNTPENRSITTTLKIDRTDFDIRYGSGNFFDNLGDKIIYDELQLNINLHVTS